MNKEKVAGILVLAVILASLVGVQQAYAKTIAPPGGRTLPYTFIESVSNPSGNCLNLGLGWAHGTVSIAPHGFVFLLQHASPSSSYGVSVGYVQNGVCNGTWQSIGSIGTNSFGTGSLALVLSLASGHHYIFEFKDTSGNIVYATDYLAL